MSDSHNRVFYDRQKRALGARAMENLQKSVVVVVGLSGLGQEIAKNTILTGVKAVYLCDDKKVEWSDLASGFYFKPEHVGKNRAESCYDLLKERNEFVRTEIIKRADLTEEFLKKITCVCFTDEPTFSLIEFNKMCRRTDTRMVCCESRGLLGSVFADMGKKFSVFDRDGEAPAENTVVDISNENPVMVQVFDENPNHGMGVGDFIVFSNVEGMEELNHKKDKKPYKIEVGKGTGKHTFRLEGVDGTKMPKYVKGTGYCKQVKPEVDFEFLPLEEAIVKGEILNYDFGKWDYGKTQCHPCFRGLYDFYQSEKRFPRPYNEEDFKKFLPLVKKYEMKPEDCPCADPKKVTIQEDFARMFCYTCRGNLNPMAALIGGVASQEVAKACSGKYTPLKQWFYIDCLECLDIKSLTSEEDAKPVGCRYDGNITVFGRDFQKKLNAQKIFMVGAGALGCEYLKNFALLGIGTKKEKGEVIVTDMDSIEESNLNRQFLFRKDHVGKMKAVCACETATDLMNKEMNCKPMTDKVAPDTEPTFNTVFWERLDCVINAVDNVKARRYVDSKCIYYEKPLIEAGTEGPKANTQCVIPFVTESYSSSQDAKETTFAGCTVKNFPYRIHHCIAWSKQKFVDFFSDSPKLANMYLENHNYVNELMASSNTLQQNLHTLEKVHAILVADRPKCFSDCISWARLLFEKYFCNDIVQMTHTIPANAETDSGLPFWSGDKRFPVPIAKFDARSEYMFEFVVSASILRAQVFGISVPLLEDRDYQIHKKHFDWLGEIGKVKLEEFVPSDKMSLKDFIQDDGKKEEEVEGEGETEKKEEKKVEMISLEEQEKLDKKRLETILSELPKSGSLSPLNIISFEKDDDSNFHIDFITSASNNRGKNYKIPSIDKYATKGIAGRIIPAMVTSTAMITGFGCFEYLKTVAGKTKIEDYKNTYSNLALPVFALSEPMPPKTQEFLGKKFSYWNKIGVDAGKDLTCEEFIKYMETEEKLEVMMINLKNGDCVYGNTEIDESKKMSKLLIDGGFKIMQGIDIMDFTVVADGINGEDIDELPDIKYKFRNFE